MIHYLNWKLYLLAGILIFLLLYFIVIFNALISLKNNVIRAWANIDVLLKQRYDELPKLIETCVQYMQYEKELLNKITQARSQAMQAREQKDVPGVNQAESVLKRSLGALFATAENYPDLKTNQSFQHLQSRISEIETAIADRREYYNDSVTINNIRLEQFPDRIVGTLLGFKKWVPMEFSKDEMSDINVHSAFTRK